MPYEWKIAIRFLTDGKAQTFFILLGIAVGGSSPDISKLHNNRSIA